MIMVATRRTRVAVCTHEMQKNEMIIRIQPTNERIESEEAKDQDPELT
jgi:hypothetical protein